MINTMTIRHHSRRRVASAFLAAAALTFAGCSTGPSENASTEPPNPSLESYGLAGLVLWVINRHNRRHRFNR